MRRGASAAAVGLLVAVTALSGCSLTRQRPEAGGTPGATGSPPASISTSAAGQSSPAASSPVPGAPVHLTLGESTTQEWSPRQGLSGRIRLSVKRVEQADWSAFKGWQVSATTRHRTRPYFLTATVANVGSTDLGGRGVPLYALDDKNQLVEASTFGSTTGRTTFGPCHPATLPAHFRHGDRMTACLVMLVPSDSGVVGATFRPDQQAQPITWVAHPRPRPARHQATS